MVPSEEDTPILWNAVRNYKTVRSDDSDKLKVRPWGRCHAEAVGPLPPGGLGRIDLPHRSCGCSPTRGLLGCVALPVCRPKAQAGPLRSLPEGARTPP